MKLGTKATKETRQKMSFAHKGKKMPPRSEEWKKKQRNAHLGKKPHYSKEAKQRLISKLKNIIYTEEHRRKIGIARSGSKSNFWRGGINNINLKILEHLLIINYGARQFLEEIIGLVYYVVKKVEKFKQIISNLLPYSQNYALL